MTGVTKKAIMRLLILAGEHCQAVMDRKMRDVRCTTIEADELWAFVGKKNKNLTHEERLTSDMGDQFTFVAMDPDTKLIPVFVVGRRNRETTRQFIFELRERVVGRIQLSTDGWISACR